MSPPAVTRARPAAASPRSTCGCTSRAWAGTRQADVPIIVRGDGCYLEDANGKRYLDALAGLFSVNIGYGVRRGDRPGRARADARAALLHELVVRPPARDRARRRGRVARARRPEPGLLRLRRLRGGRVGVEARAAVLHGPRREAAASGSRTSRSGDTTRSWPRPARRAATRRSRGTSRTTARLSARSPSTASRRCESRSSRSSPRCGTSRTRTGTTGRRRRPRRSSRGSSSTSSSRRSSPWGPRRCASCTWSRCRTPAAAFTPPDGLLAGRAGAVRRVRHPALGRRGDHRVRPARLLVRLGALRHPAGHRHLAPRGSRPRTRRSAR